MPIPGFEGFYSVSDMGHVLSVRRNRLLTPAIDRYGYERVTLAIGGKLFYRTIHRLVAQTFVPNPNNLETVNHINEVKTDNRAVNLEWASVADNDNHGTRNARIANTKCIRPVEQIYEGEVLARYRGVKDASLKTGIHRCCIAKCCKNLGKTAGGYEWRYVDEAN